MTIPHHLKSTVTILGEYYLKARKIDWNTIDKSHNNTITAYKRMGLYETFKIAQPILLAKALTDKTKNEYLFAELSIPQMMALTDDVYSRKHLGFLLKLNQE